MPIRVLTRGVFLIFLLLLAGTVFYNQAEGMSIIDAFYLSGAVISTSTYGDANVVIRTDAGKIFSVIYTLVGIGTLFYVLGKMFHILLTHTLLDPVFHERHQLYYKQLLANKKRRARRTARKR